MKYTWFVIFLLFSLAVSAQKSARVRELENQRKKALDEIEVATRLLSETEKSAQTSLNRLNLLVQQITSRRKVINLLNQEITAIDSQIESTRKEIAALEKELGVKKDNYNKSIQGLYKKRSSQDRILFVLSADNFAQSLRRMRYLREYADWQKIQANEILLKQQEISLKKEELERTRSEKHSLLAERESESRKLQTEEQSQKREVDTLNKKKNRLQADLKKKQQQAANLNRQIEKQIAAEIEAAAKAERERLAKEKAKEPGVTVAPERKADSKGGYAMTKAEKELADNFAGNRGRLPFPVTGRYTVVGNFGVQQHPQLKGVTIDNSGIDIQTTPGAEARAVFNGTVTRSFVVPGYNNSVIIRHGNYLTVYSNLSEIYVKQGDKVNTRQVIGKVFTDAENGNATILHFQLWKETKKLNPRPWLD